MSVERVTFESGGRTVVGALHLPDGDDRPRGAIVLSGPITSVKEQVTGAYAKALAERGFAALAFDHRHFGESGGEPRQLESPARKIEDVRAAIAWLAGRDELAGLPVHGLGVCAGGGYMAGAAMVEPRIERFAGVAGFYSDAEGTRASMGDDYDRAIERAEAAREAFERGEAVPTIPAVGTEGEVAMPLDEAFDYYGTERGAVANYTNAYAVQSRAETLPFDVQGRAGELRQPALVVHSENALAPALARRFFDALPGEKRELWLETKGQTDFYDDPATIARASDAVAAHFAG